MSCGEPLTCIARLVVVWCVVVCEGSHTPYALHSQVDGLANEKNWFAELGTLWPGQAMCLQYDKILFHKRSEYQACVQFVCLFV